MNSRQRIKALFTGKPVDRYPFTSGMGMWGSTYERWKKESGNPNLDLNKIFGFDEGFYSISDYRGYVRLGLCPWFPDKIIEVKERSVVRQDIFGIVREDLKSEYGESIANFLSYPVTSWDSWKRVKEERLNIETPERFTEDILSVADAVNNGNNFVVLGDYPYGLFGTCRDLMGVEDLLINFYDEPELIADMMEHLTTLWLSVYEKVVKHIKIDCVHMWEDMSGKQGSLISPNMVKDFMLPNYRRISEFCKRNDIEIFSVDTDGNADELVPLYISAGVNFVFPFEVAAGCDIAEYRRLYPELAMMGGIDKREIAKDKIAIDREMKRVADVLPKGRYLPAMDHLIHPEVSWENYCYYNKVLKEITFGNSGGI